MFDFDVLLWCDVVCRLDFWFEVVVLYCWGDVNVCVEIVGMIVGLLSIVVFECYLYCVMDG